MQAVPLDKLPLHEQQRKPFARNFSGRLGTARLNTSASMKTLVAVNKSQTKTAPFNTTMQGSHYSTQQSAASNQSSLTNKPYMTQQKSGLKTHRPSSSSMTRSSAMKRQPSLSSLNHGKSNHQQAVAKSIP